MHLDPRLTIMTDEVYIVAHTVQLGWGGAQGGIPTLHMCIYDIHMYMYMYLHTARPAPLHT